MSVLPPNEASRIVAPHVLIVDDVDMMRDLLGMQLSRAGCRYDSAEDGVQALAALHARRYDLVLMDRSMPNMDGCEAARSWRAHEQAQGLPMTPIVGVGGQPDDRVDCLAAGMQEFMTKPLTIAALDGLLKRFLHDGAA